MLRKILSGIHYVQRDSVLWDAIPKHLLPHRICYELRRLLTDVWHQERVNDYLVAADRERARRSASPTQVSIDAVGCNTMHRKANGARCRQEGVDRKCHIMADGDNRLLAVRGTTADVQDQDGGIPLVESLIRRSIAVKATRANCWLIDSLGEHGRVPRASDFHVFPVVQSPMVLSRNDPSCT